MNFQVIIPMSGKGERFLRAGYKKPKPLVEVNGKPIIAHVLDMFPGEKNVIFICNKDHLEKTDMKEVLNTYCPSGKIVSINPHKYGPVYAVSKVFELIENELPVLVNYCDFSCYWNYQHFKDWLVKVNPDGCVPAYRGFHPHSLLGNNYAFMRVKDGWMQEIQEKKPFTSNKIDEFASSGTYYFSKGNYLKRFFSETISKNIDVNGEFYCSVVYNLMVNAGLSVSVYELQHFMQWGTPEDLAEFNMWSNAFKALSSKKSPSKTVFSGTTLIPMAGKGSRFKQANYQIPKPLLQVSGAPMVVQAVKSLPKTENYNFVALEESFLINDLDKLFEEQFTNSKVTRLEKVSNGQACTCLSALNEIPPSDPLTISACDHGVLYDENQFYSLMKNKDIDVIVWVTKGHPGAIRHPEMYGWVRTKGSEIIDVSVKKVLDNPASDLMIIGTFTFKSSEIFKKCANNLIDRDERVNGEYYVDSCIKDAISLGYRCHFFMVDHYFCWGTPNDLKSFEYWQSCFHKWKSHSYSWENDPWKIDLTSSVLPKHLEIVNYELPKTNLNE